MSAYSYCSWHEIGTHDLPAMIDHVVKITGEKNMFYLGHSQGTTSFFVMAAERPEYQDKIKEMYAMAPIAYCGRMTSPFLQLISQFSVSIEVCDWIKKRNLPLKDFRSALQWQFKYTVSVYLGFSRLYRIQSQHWSYKRSGTIGVRGKCYYSTDMLELNVPGDWLQL